MDDNNNLSADQAMVSVLSKSEIEQQISTAHKFPRDIDRFLSKAASLVGKTVETAQQCIYALPRDGKIIKGPSARFAEIVAAAYGNCRAGARVVDDTGSFIVAQGVFHDLESNTAITYEVQRRIKDKGGRRYKDDMIGVTANAACSIALRNAILKGVPKAIWQSIYDTAEKTSIGDIRTLTDRRAKAMAIAMKMGATPDHVFATLEVKGLEGIDNDKLFELCSILQAIKDGDSNVDDAFSLNERPKAESLNERLKGEPEATQEAAGATQSEPVADAKPADPAAEPAPDAQPQEAKPRTRRKPAEKPPTEPDTAAPNVEAPAAPSLNLE